MHQNRTLLLLPILLLFASCIQHKQMLNFNEGPDFNTVAQQLALANPILIQPDDLLSVSVQTTDPETSAPFNTGTAPADGSSASGVSVAPTYLVDANGAINMPILGKIKVAGWGTLQARDSLTARLGKYLTTPIVNVRLVNFKFTVLGEVGKAGSYTIPNERINILEALGMAGDLTNYGDREKILIIREKDGKRSFGYLDLHQRDLFNSPYYYLAQNDILYVEPVKAKVGATADGATKYVQWLAPVISIISIIVSLSR